MKRIKENIRFACLAAVAIGFAACSQDELSPAGTAEGTAVQIGSVSIGSKVETRVSENPDDGGKSSLWNFDGTEQIAVQVKDGVQGVYTLNEDKTVTTTQPTYWTGSGTQTINAWYPVESDNIDLSNQSAGHLAYALFATATGTYPDAVALNFSHSLAKLRVRLSGNVDAIKKIEAKNFTSCSLNTANGTVTGNDEGYIPLSQATYSTTDGLVTYWEANVAPGAVANDVLRFNDSFNAGIASVTQFEARKIYTVTYTVMSSNIVTFEGCTIEEWKKEQGSSGTTGMSKLDYFIDDDGTYLVYTEAGLRAWAARVSSGGNATNCKLMADIVLPYTNETTANWEPVGTEANPYTGTFDGNGHSIIEMVIVKPGGENVGFIGYLDGGVVKNLSFSQRESESFLTNLYGAKNVGTVVGTNRNGMVINCRSSALIRAYSSSSSYNVEGAILGGIVGYNLAYGGNAHVIACEFTGRVSRGLGGSYLGGIVGMSSAAGGSRAYIVACGYKSSRSWISLSDNASVSTTNKAYMGGIVGYEYINGAAAYSWAIGCYSVGEITKKHDWQVAGSIAGWTYNSYMSSWRGTVGIRGCYGTNADVLVGDQNNGEITDCSLEADASATANAAIKDWNSSNGDLCQWHIEHINNSPTIVGGAPD